ncbi:unnamed protein product [Pleuronectes platessa]|uniref:Uncharacterized protein n=1 Tax=Pleuronectes platessa TaxID=8262 RepID=A0A9N7Z3K2_PLEPL|nr:unnamed protein product [Pleuronectes platessa]
MEPKAVSQQIRSVLALLRAHLLDNTEKIERSSRRLEAGYQIAVETAPRSTPSHPCQRIFLLGRPVPIRQGARPFKTPREHETEPGRDVSWLSHLPVSGMSSVTGWPISPGEAFTPNLDAGVVK